MASLGFLFIGVCSRYRRSAVSGIRAICIYRGTPEYKHHIEARGKHTEFGYKDFIPLFTAPEFDAKAWEDLFAKAGAKFVVPVAEHHDGFQMYKSEISHWNAFEMGPKRDVVLELREVFDQVGLVTGVSSHRIEHWFLWDTAKRFPAIFTNRCNGVIYTDHQCRRPIITMCSANPHRPGSF